MVIAFDWLSDRLVEVLQWQLVNPGREDGPEVPYAGLRVWSIFLDLNGTRGAGGFGPASSSASSETEMNGEVMAPL